MRARRLVYAALDRQAELDTDSAVALLRAARIAAPRAFEPHFRYVGLMSMRGASAELEAEYGPVVAGGDPLERCFAAVALSNRVPKADRRSIARDAEGRYGRTTCSSVLSAQSHEGAGAVGHWEWATRLSPELVHLWVSWAGALQALNRRDDERRVLEAGIRQAGHPLNAVWLRMTLAQWHLEAGDTLRAEAMRRAVEAAVRRDGRPGVRLSFLEQLVAWSRSVDQRVASLRTLVETAARLGSWPHEYGRCVSLAGLLIDVGRPSDAIPCANRSIFLADSVGSRRWQVEAYTKRGRALAKAGRVAEAQRDLGHAVQVGAGTRESYLLADAYHNLAHVYESNARFAAAARAGTAFVDHARSLEDDPLRVMSWRDLGLIQWKAGWHAAADASFVAMVQAIDSLGRANYWAGEYFERRGDLERGALYYRRAATVERGDVVLSLAGLARTYEALGLLDSSETAARAHDSVGSLVGANTPLAVPLLPRILARRGAAAQAIELAWAWSGRQEGQGNLHGAALGALEHAELLLEARRPRDAIGAAQRATRLATGMNLTDELERALRLEGAAVLALGDQAQAVTLLRRADSVMRAHPTHDGLLRTATALGEALEQAGHERDALAAYARAAAAAERAAASFAVDLDRVRYRDRHLSPYNRALRLLIGSPNAALAASREDSVLSWSQRRKGAVLALALGQGGPGAHSGARAVPGRELRRRLALGEALLDYLVIDSLVAVTVVRPDSIILLRLQFPADSLASLIDRLRRPLVARYAGRVDLARAHFNLNVAHRLYLALMAPVEPFLGGVERLLIVPDGALHYLPFDALVSGMLGDRDGGAADYATARYVVDRYEIVYVPSVQFLLPASRGSNGAPPGRSRIIVVARDVPGGEREVAAVSQAWGAGRVTILAGRSATETAVRTAARDENAILHFASHTTVDDRDPLASYLQLGADASNDGYLHFGEISSDRYGARLIVLSACETVAGRLYAGEGLMSITRAFLRAGATTVVATQWPVDSSAAHLMAAFHRSLAAGAAPVTALRSAKLALRSRPETAHPFRWAGFVVASRVHDRQLTGSSHRPALTPGSKITRSPVTAPTRARE